MQFAPVYLQRFPPFLSCFQPSRPWNAEIDAILNRAFEAGLVRHYLRGYVPARVLNARSEQLAPPPSAFKLGKSKSILDKCADLIALEVKTSRLHLMPGLFFFLFSEHVFLAMAVLLVGFVIAGITLAVERVNGKRKTPSLPGHKK